jgi:hypothetical protein
VGSYEKCSRLTSEGGGGTANGQCNCEDRLHLLPVARHVVQELKAEVTNLKTQAEHNRELIGDSLLCSYWKIRQHEIMLVDSEQTSG